MTTVQMDSHTGVTGNLTMPAPSGALGPSPLRGREGRCAVEMCQLGESTTALSIQCSSSRTLPGHAWARSNASAPSSMRGRGRP